VPHGPVGRVGDTGQVDRELLIAYGVGDLAGPEDAGAVDQDVDPAEPLGDLVHHGRHLAAVGLVGLDALGAHALRPQFLH
jgi:hypothetical protein